jgi:hypothetical protein
MADEHEPTVAYYRKTANEIRELASKAQLPEVQRDLLELAERFERMSRGAMRPVAAGCRRNPSVRIAERDLLPAVRVTCTQAGAVSRCSDRGARAC